MSKSKKYLLQRSVWYLAGFVLLYAPFALLQRFLISVFKLSGRPDIHGACFRMAAQGLFTGKGLNLLTTSGIIVLLLFVSAFFLGPVFCGRLCLTGAVPEYLSRMIPEKLKINWQKHIYPTPIRYGITAGFLITPALSLSVVCAYCNYTFMERLILGGINLDIGIMSSTAILTGFIWLFVLGIFAQGGRGFCTYLCPIGAFQSLIHSIGARLGFTYKLKFSKEKCINCNQCVKDCPMGSLQNGKEGLKYNIHTCITCHQCKHSCPKSAISYGRGQGLWNVPNPQSIDKPTLTV